MLEVKDRIKRSEGEKESRRRGYLKKGKEEECGSGRQGKEKWGAKGVKGEE